MKESIDTYKDRKGNIIAIVIKADYSNQGIRFFTKDEDYMQVAYMGHPSGHVIAPHYHNILPRRIDYTCETLIMRKGEMKVNLYDNKDMIHSFSVFKGDIVTLFGGGHGFEMVKDVEMVEIKQGPFLGSDDKTRF